MNHPRYASRRSVLVAAIASCAALAVGQPPVVTDWKFNANGAKGSSSDGTVHAVVSLIDADAQEVWYTATNAYVATDSIPSHPVGPWPGGGPTYPTASNNVYQLPLTVPASPAANHVETPLGAIGVMVNGVQLFNWSDATSWENEDVWHYNAPEVRPLDAGLGHPSPGQMARAANGLRARGDSHGHRWTSDPMHSHSPRAAGRAPGVQAGGAYHYHTYPPLLGEQLDDDGTRHSPILGWSFDGIPIYGSHGYSNPASSSSTIKRIVPSWRLRTIAARTSLAGQGALPANLQGPPINAQNPLGTFAEDYEYAAASGDLDEYNGRFCVTPEYPGGTYAYFATRKADGDPAWPYTVGPTYRSTPINANLGPNGGHVTIPGTATRYVPQQVVDLGSAWIIR